MTKERFLSLVKYDTKRRQAATPERLCDCGRQAVVFKSNSYVCAYCLSQPPASAYLDYRESACVPETFSVRLASYDPEMSDANDGQWAGSYMRVATTCVLAVLWLVLVNNAPALDVRVAERTGTTWSAEARWDIDTNNLGYVLGVAGEPGPNIHAIAITNVYIIVDRSITRVLITNLTLAPHYFLGPGTDKSVQVWVDPSVTPPSPPPASHLLFTKSTADHTPTIGPPYVPLAANTWSAALNWTPSTDGRAVAQKVYWGAEGNGRANQIQLSAQENRQTLRGFANGQKYAIEVVALTDTGVESVPLTGTVLVEVNK